MTKLSRMNSAGFGEILINYVGRYERVSSNICNYTVLRCVQYNKLKNTCRILYGRIPDLTILTHVNNILGYWILLPHLNIPVESCMVRY